MRKNVALVLEMSQGNGRSFSPSLDIDSVASIITVEIGRERAWRSGRERYLIIGPKSKWEHDFLLSSKKQNAHELGNFQINKKIECDAVDAARRRNFIYFTRFVYPVRSNNVDLCVAEFSLSSVPFLNFHFLKKSHFSRVQQIAFWKSNQFLRCNIKLEFKPIKISWNLKIINSGFSRF